MYCSSLQNVVSYCQVQGFFLNELNTLVFSKTHSIEVELKLNPTKVLLFVLIIKNNRLYSIEPILTFDYARKSVLNLS